MKDMVDFSEFVKRAGFGPQAAAQSDRQGRRVPGTMVALLPRSLHRSHARHRRGQHARENAAGTRTSNILKTP